MLSRHLLSIRRCAQFALALTVFSLSSATSSATDFAIGGSLRDLPVFDATTEAYKDDWLIRPPRQRAGVYRTRDDKAIVLSNGLIARTFRLAPNGATVAFDDLRSGAALLRGVKPEAELTIDGQPIAIGGLRGQPNYAFLRPEWIDTLTADPEAFVLTGFSVGDAEERMAWNRVRHHAPGVQWPPAGVHLRMDYARPETNSGAPRLSVSVHYELYDAVPVLSKWITLRNESDTDIVVDTMTIEILAAVEHASAVEDRGMPFQHPTIHVETDYAFGGMSTLNSSKPTVHWVRDPEYDSQVNYLKNTPCLLRVEPDVGPGATVIPGETFESFRAWILPFENSDRERNGLAQRQLYRTIAPWTTENPLMMHVRYSDWETVKRAIDQCAEVGFEMVILTFGSGFNVEDRSPEFRAEMTRYAAYAKSKNIELGGYSLLASRSIDPANDVVMPPGQTPTFGKSPCLQSAWGRDYFANLYDFYATTGFAMLEHDGNYPGDVCTSTDHPGHRGYDDSQWAQWRMISDFYRWCREQGIYLNVPDYYYLAGSNKCGMGYREVNWSLSREEQVIHTRQNIYDGTWQKLPSMGWMFVPLSEYHGGGEAATIEPLDAHRDHYERMLVSNLALGVQACYRGPRLYDTDRTKALLTRWVGWFKKYRDILESDLVHGRRADARDLDWMLHVNPALPHKGMLVVFNPRDEPVTRRLNVNLYYTGLDENARIREQEGPLRSYTLSRDFSVDLEVSVEAQGFTWFVIE